ncbi:MAG: T9SS type A sorting domain-containing protein [Bacteroidota bacterium]|nr:T9SS type A sorting domain-containing protein [Bacteroidota bacterium]
MKKLLLFLTIITAGYFIFTGHRSQITKNTMEEKAPPIRNIHKLTKLYTERGLTQRHSIDAVLNSTIQTNGISLRSFSNVTPQYKSKIINTFLCEGFSSTTFPPVDWTLEYTGDLFWLRDTVSSYGVGTGSAVFYFYTAFPGTIQSLITLTFDSSTAGDSLKFDHAYCTYEIEVDQLQIETSTNGGNSYTTLIILDGGVSGPLVTAPPSLDIFFPSSDQWATKKYSLPPGTNKISFKALSDYGNNLFLDSICVVSPIVGISNVINTNIPGDYFLSQNSPNPFNPVTKINYQLPKADYVTLKIYDDLGKEVASLINSRQDAGKYSVEFNAGNLSSGIYFYKIQSGEFAAVKRMVLIK